MKKVVVLIDGQNLYYNLRDMKIVEKDVDWTKLFNAVTDGHELVRTYWFRPEKIHDTFFTEENMVKSLIYKHYKNQLERYKNGGMSALPENVQAEIQDRLKSAQEWLVAEKRKFSNLEYAYDQLCIYHDDIEIVKKGVVKVDQYAETYKGEKGVDIALAVKMIALSVERKCDIIVLVSGDYDYAEAIQYAKNNMTKVYVAKIHRGFPPKSKSMSRDLTVLADKVIDIYEEELKSIYKYSR